ncbi:ABC transporter ATP-binding protein [Lichenibacterium dinghuense]|uniref:ABC transporter ATP-binding protein n=1 Tax=Lichenibacterium dinghuense TaxID=2895977 RepID=UPI001F1A73BE|nr:ABC transporter ATP-binding protein [Lichenibacterium sp. 6Y81]
MATDILALSAVQAFYGDSHVLHGVSLRLGAGRLLGLLGRNGAGKSTCLNAIVGLVQTRGGSIAVAGETVRRPSPEAMASRRVAIVPQGRRIFRSLTVRENLAVAARRPAKDAPVAWSLDSVFAMFPRLRERQSQHAGLMSGGEQQMLAIGRALMTNPRVLLMDEPSEGLAPQIVAEVGRIIARLRGEGLSIVLVEQNIKLALELCDDVALINTGSVVFTGTAAALAADEATIAQHLGVF